MNGLCNVFVLSLPLGRFGGAVFINEIAQPQ
jgi:hypothetical protein